MNREHRERANFSCPSCDSSDVFRSDGDVFRCERCGKELTEAREARASKGAAIYLSDAQLSMLGADTDAKKLRYWVDDAGLHVEEGATHQ